MQANTRSMIYADASYYPMQATTRSMIYAGCALCRLLPAHSQRWLRD